MLYVKNGNLKYTWIGTIAAVIGIVAIIPLVIRVTQKKTTHSLSYSWLTLALVANILWAFYGYSNNMFPVIFSSVVFMVINTYLIAIKIAYESMGIDAHTKLETEKEKDKKRDEKRDKKRDEHKDKKTN